MVREANEPPQLRRVVFVMLLLFMLAFSPALDTSYLRVQPVAIEFVMPARRRRRRKGGRTLYPAFSTRDTVL